MRNREQTIAERIVAYVRQFPGKTEREIASAVIKPGAAQQRVNQDCRLLWQRGILVRRGVGGNRDPYRYYPA